MRGTVQVTIDQTDGEAEDLTVRSLTVQGDGTTHTVVEQTRAGWVARCLDDDGTELPDYAGWTFGSDREAALAGLLYGWERGLSA